MHFPYWFLMGDWKSLKWNFKVYAYFNRNVNLCEFLANYGCDGMNIYQIEGIVTNNRIWDIKVADYDFIF